MRHESGIQKFPRQMEIEDPFIENIRNNKIGEIAEDSISITI